MLFRVGEEAVEVCFGVSHAGALHHATRAFGVVQFQDARLVEVTLAAGSPAAGKSIAELGVPRDATIVAVIRERHVIVPRGETVVEPGDEVLVLVTPDSEDEVKALLVGQPQPA
jgi:Trk K+ transport system NAD-binding subunit